MPRPYSNDLRARVIEAIEAGASCREATARGDSLNYSYGTRHRQPQQLAGAILAP